MRVLVAFEDARFLYRDTISRAIRELRPGLEVFSVPLSELEYYLGSIAPHVVICSQPNSVHPGSRGAWVEIKTDDGAQGDERLAEICLEGEQWRIDDPPLSEILRVIDETQERLREGDLSEVC